MIRCYGSQTVPAECWRSVQHIAALIGSFESPEHPPHYM